MSARRSSYEGDEHLSVRARPDALVRAVENLVENALKYGSQAVLRTGREDGDRVYIEVEDDGVGIAEDERQAMLEPFVRGDAARTSPAGGFGLGLSITASIANSHGGDLCCRAAAWAGCSPGWCCRPTTTSRGRRRSSRGRLFACVRSARGGRPDKYR